MKNILRQKAKSALSILLTICVLLSCVSVGVFSVSAAEADVAEEGANVNITSSGWDNTKKWYIKNSFTDNGWDSGTPTMKLDSNDNTVLYYNFYLTNGESIRWHYWSQEGNDHYLPLDSNGNNYGNANTIGYDSHKLGKKADHYNNWQETPDWYVAPTVSAGSFKCVTVKVDLDGYSNAGAGWADVSDVAAMTTSLSLSSATKSTTYNLANYVSSANLIGSSATYTYSITAPNGSTSTSSSWTPNQRGNYTITITATDTGVVTSGGSTQNAKTARTATATKTIAVKEKLIKPTITVSKSGTANVGDTDTTITIDNYSNINAQGDTGTTFELYKDSAKMNSGYTFDSTTGVFTLDTITSSSGATYQVKAVAGTTASYQNSDKSSSKTLTVYSPEYCIVGDDVDDGYCNLGGSVITTTVPVGDDNYFNTWQENLAIATPVAGSPGKYSFTFTVNETSSHKTINMCIAKKTDPSDPTDTEAEQFAYITAAGVDYNTASDDLVISDDGVASNQLYVNNIAAVDPGGSLILKKGQTYTVFIDQTKRYNNNVSYPVGEITITTTDAFVNTAAKKMAYNPTTRTWDAVTDAAAIIGSASVVPTHGAKTGFNATLTAVRANNTYEFIGWYEDDAACAGDPDFAYADCSHPATDTDTYALTSIISTVNYYALFKQIQPTDVALTVTQPSSSDGSFVITGGTKYNVDNSANTDASTVAYPGATVSVTATPASGKEIAYWKITNTLTGQDVTTQVMANKSNLTSSFTMPAYPATITAVFRNRTVATVNTSVNIPGLGTVAITESTPYYVNDVIHLTATNTNGEFKNWTVTGGTISNLNSKTPTLTISSSTVNVKAVFDYKTYELYYDTKKLPLVRQSDGSYVSSFKIPGSSSKFTVYNKTDGVYANANAASGNSYHFTSSLKTASVYQSDTEDDDAWLDTAPTTESQYITESNVTGYLVFYPPGSTVDSEVRKNGYLKLVDTNPMGTIAQIYAKDGSIRYATSGSSSGNLWSSGGVETCVKGVTTVTSINNSSVTNPDDSKYPSYGLSNHLKIYSAPIGSTITIQTNMKKTYKDQGFYVGMFVINGWKVDATKTFENADTATYTANYTLTADVALNDTSSNKSFEITPVYYNKYFDYITFYVDAASVPTATWGQTISTEAYYKGATNSHFEGSYPGQPLGREGDMYEIKVAKCYYEYSASTTTNGGWTAHTNRVPSATITSYMYDVVHHYYYVTANNNLDSETKNHQTYDYADFAYLAQIKDIEAIMFRCKVSENDNRSDIDDDAYPDTERTYELLTDYYGNPIDALGNRLLKPDNETYYTAAELAEADAQVKIISAGNCNTESASSQRTKGKWATFYMAYDLSDEDGDNCISMRSTPADYINYNINTPSAADTNTVEFKKHDWTTDSGKSVSDLRNKITYISYDQMRTNSIGGVSDTGRRIDGRWYFSAQSEFTSNVKVAIQDMTEGATFNAKVDGSASNNAKIDIEADSNSANNTGFIGNTSKTKVTLDDETTHTYRSVNSEAELKANVGSGYTFVGWYLYDEAAGTYTKIHDNFNDTNTTMTMKKSYTIVAVVKAVPEGTLVINHSRFTGDNPEPAHEGKGKYYVGATVYESDGTTVKGTYAETLNSLSIPELSPSDKLEITLHTVCSGNDLFYAWYEEGIDYDDGYKGTGRYYEICSEGTDPKDEREVSYTFFIADCSNFFSSSTLVRSTLDFYSDILHETTEASITYKYYDRFNINGDGQMVSYTVKGVELNYDEIAAGCIPSDEKIAKYAPDVIDTIFTDTRWVVTDVDNKVQRSMSNVTVVATQSNKDCFVRYLTPTAIEEYLVDDSGNILNQNNLAASWTNTSTAYNDWVLKPDARSTTDDWDYDDFLVRAPESFVKNDVTYTFQRYDVYRIMNRKDATIGDLVYSCNESVFGYRIFTDCVIYPVYTAAAPVAKTLKATIEPAVLNREVWGSVTNITDRLYADLVIASLNADSVNSAIPKVIRDNDPSQSGYLIETGVIVDRAKILSVVDYNTLHDAAVNGNVDTTQSVITNSDYTGTFITDGKFDTLLKNNALNDDNTAKDKQISDTYNDTNSVKHTLIKYVNNNQDLTTKNRIDKVLLFNNSDAARRYIFAAYSYVVIRTADGTFVQAAISDPQYFNFCYIGNKPIETDLTDNS